MSVKTPDEIRTERTRTLPPAGLITIAALWPKKGENLGTLLRTCDALRARLVTDASSDARQALRKGDTVGQPGLWHCVTNPEAWLLGERFVAGARVVAVELAHGATPLAELGPATTPTVLLLGNETIGIPERAMELATEVVEIPMLGVGNSLNVAVAGSLVAYKLAGLT